MSFNGINHEPVWESGPGGIAVYVNGGIIEISSPPTMHFEPDEAEPLALEFTQALVEARRWARRWNTETRSYDALEPDGA